MCVDDACIVVCDGLRGLPDAIGATRPTAVTQTCVLHLIRHTLRLAGRQHWDRIAKDLRPIHTAPTEPAAEVEVRRVIFSTNAVELLNARFRRAVRTRGHFPSDQAALKCLYLTLRSLDPPGRGSQRWAVRWRPVLDAFALMCEGRIIPV